MKTFLESEQTNTENRHNVQLHAEKGSSIKRHNSVNCGNRGEKNQVVTVNDIFTYLTDTKYTENSTQTTCTLIFL